MTNLLELRAIEAGYDQSAILRGVDLEIPPKSVVSLLGRNGVGKTTTLKTIMGLVSATAGEINLDGQPLGKMKPENRARTGLGYVPQGRDIFSSMTVWENLKVSLSIYGKESADRLDEVYQLSTEKAASSAAASSSSSPSAEPSSPAQRSSSSTNPPKVSSLQSSTKSRMPSSTSKRRTT